KDFRLADGSYPKRLDYKDYVELDQVKDRNGNPFPLEPGMVLEYWLEATDNSDYPVKTGNVGESKRYSVTIDKKDPDPKQVEQERQQAAEEQKQHEAAQDQKQQAENQAIQEQRNQQQGADQQPKDKGSEKNAKSDPEQEKKDQETARQLQKLKEA